MTEDYNANIAIIQQRWPSLANSLSPLDTSQLNAHLVEGNEQTISVNNIQLSSRHHKLKEAQLLASQISDNTQFINLYGTGLGDLQRVILNRPELRLLNVVILNPLIFKLVLQHTSQYDWLSNERVELKIVTPAARVQKPFVAITSEIKLAETNALKLCDHLLTEMHHDFIHKDHQSLPKNAVKHIEENIALIQHDSDVATLYNSQVNREVYVVGSGPSLETTQQQIIKALKHAEKPLIIAVDTALKALDKYNITPDIVVTIDHEIEEKHLQIKEQKAIKLVYFPCIQNHALNNWQGARYTAYSVSKLYDSIYHKHPKGRLNVGGSVIHPAVDLAAKIGASSITFFGCDFSFPNNKTHAVWDEVALGLAHNKQQCSVLNGHNKNVSTVPTFRSYLCELENFIQHNNHIRFYNSSREGAVINGALYKEPCGEQP